MREEDICRHCRQPKSKHGPRQRLQHGAFERKDRASVSLADCWGYHKLKKKQPDAVGAVQPTVEVVQ